ncbi:MAG: hypothetical protein K6T91_08970 [Firmicutes bacterium]|nr:hypothetical protein [Bacillota bacterium]
MDLNVNNIIVAAISYLTGAVALYAYFNRNRYFDLVLATVAVFIFGTSMLLLGFRIDAGIARTLINLSTVVMVLAILFFIVRLVGGISTVMKRYFRKK